MSVRLYADAVRVAIYEEASGGGDPLDPNSLMNRPVLSPSAWLGNVFFHSDFDYYGTAFYVPSIAINHAAVPGATTPVSYVFSLLGQVVRTNHLIVQHNLGFVPRFFLLSENGMIPHGTPIQNDGEGRKRFVTGYATTTQIRLFDLGYSSDVQLVASTRNYGCMVFGPSAADPLLDKLLIEPGNVVFGQGKFRMEWPHLRIVASGESPFVQATSRTAGIADGVLRVWPANGSPIDFGPGTYNGDLTSAPNFISVRAGV